MSRIISSSAAQGTRVRELFQRAVAQVRAAHFIDAMTYLEDILELDPSHADALACRGWIHALHGNSLAARVDLQAALRHAPVGWPRRGEVLAQLTVEDDDDALPDTHDFAHEPTIAA
jgi:Tfp pilus assembly protein PilF